MANACRAERFGTDYVQPEKRSDLRQQFRRERLKKDGFKTGLDLFDEVRPWSAHSPELAAAMLPVQPEIVRRDE